MFLFSEYIELINKNDIEAAKSYVSKTNGINAVLHEDESYAFGIPFDYDITPLMIAAIRQKTDLVLHLLESGANVFAVSDPGFTALEYCENKENIEIKTLLKAEILRRIAPERPFMLMLNIKYNNIANLKALVANVPDINFQASNLPEDCFNGFTPLTLATKEKILMQSRFY